MRGLQRLVRMDGQVGRLAEMGLGNIPKGCGGGGGGVVLETT